MSSYPLNPDALVLYKQRPARVIDVGAKKITIQDDSNRLQVRPKDVVVLHPGPLRSLHDLRSLEGEVESAWELFAGGPVALNELAELAYGEFTPVTAWAAWELVADGLYFTGTPDAILARTPEARATEEAARAAKAAEEAAWHAFAARVEAGTFVPDDAAYLQDVEELALGKRDQSRTLHVLGRSETPQDAHAFLLRLGYWSPAVNPYPARFDMPTTDPELTLPPLADESRRDLTALRALAIDDEGSKDPDDAISIDGARLWVHVADVAVLAKPDTALDMEARARGGNLYLPEGTVHMLPAAATAQLALGLQEISPALSIGIEMDEEGTPLAVEIVPSWVRVERMSYGHAETQLDDPLLARLAEMARVNQARRLANGALEIRLPEAKVRVADGEITISALPPLVSRNLVREAMLMAGEAVARFAVAHEIPMLFTVQNGPDVDEISELQAAETMAEMFAVRRLLKPGRQKPEVAPHAGLGIDYYVQATSPLRRYLDLVAHQQLRAFLAGQPLLDEEALAARLAAYRAVIGNIRQCERASNNHWTLVSLMRNPGWQGSAVVVERRGARVAVIVEDLALDSELYADRNLDLDQRVTLAVSDVDLAQLETRFRMVG